MKFNYISRLILINNLNKKYYMSLWRILFFSGFSLYLFTIFSNNAFKPIEEINIIINGNNIYEYNDVKRAAKIKERTPLLNIIPKRISNTLKGKLSLQSVSARRQLFPPSLIIDIRERQPVAYARRLISDKYQYGLIDLDAIWIPIKWEKISSKYDIKLKVFGWKNNHKESISYIIKNRFNLGSSLKEIKLNSKGGLVLKTDIFNSVILGADYALIPQQLKVLAYLSENLPKKLNNKKFISIDLRDLSKPELQTDK